MSRVYLGIGANIGNKEENLKQAIELIAEHVGDVLCVSSFYSSLPWGFSSSNDFLNAVLLVDSQLTPLDLLSKTQAVEKQMGRKQKSVRGYADRIIDIDLLLYDSLVLNKPNLQIPHPLMHKRDFVLKPLAEIAPSLQHPSLGKKIEELLREL